MKILRYTNNRDREFTHKIAMKRYYDKENKRLVYIGESATPEFWDEHWDTQTFRATIEKGKNNRFVLRILSKYIPDKNGRILEGGCGMGQIVFCMKAHGYQAIGVDFADKTVENVKEAMPELDVRVGDVRNLPFPDDYFVGYWSLGVIEHFWDGYQDILEEMRRTVVNGGFVFVSFPYMSLLRRLKARLGLYEESREDTKADFYQFALDPETVVNNFKTMGFTLLHAKPTSGLKGSKDEVTLFKHFLQRLFDYQGDNLAIKGLRFILDKLLSSFAGHMIFLVLRNEKKKTEA